MDKNKKILKGIGIGALACVGMIGLTGCSKVEIGQDKVDSMIETVEKADKRLDEYVDLLEQQNQQLQDQNKKLEELLEDAKNMTKEEVWNLAQTAEFNLIMNVDGLRDNLLISGYNEELGLQQDMMIYYNSDSMSVFAELDNDNGVESAELWYQKSGSNVVLAGINKDGNEYICNSAQDRGEEAIFERQIGVYNGGIPGIGTFGLSYEDLSHYEALENGNMRLTFVKREVYGNPNEEYVAALETTYFEYSKEGKLVSFGYDNNILDINGEFSEGMLKDLSASCTVSLLYGEVDTELVESWVELSEAKIN